jgi:hypothetical protein
LHFKVEFSMEVPMPKKVEWSHRLLLWCLILLSAVFFTVAAYGISHWRGAPFSPTALTVVFVVTGILALAWFALLSSGRN